MNGSLRIDKGIPIPPSRTGIGVTPTLKKLKVGDSFSHTKSSRSGIYALAKQVGIEVVVRNHESDQNLVRVWRIK